MAQSGDASSTPLSLDDLIALNKEIASLVRADVPLPVGLRAMASDASRPLRMVAEQLAERLERGESLMQAVESLRGAVPPVYAAVVAGGLRAGRLPEALESLTRIAGTAVEIRRQLIIASIVPLSVIVVAYAMLIAFVVFVVPEIQSTYRSLEIDHNWWIATLSALHNTVVYWAAIPPLVCLTAWLLFKYADATPHASDGIRGGPFRLGGFGWLPGVRRISHTWHWANFADLWGLLVSHDVVLPDALDLASQATGDRRIIVATRPLIERVRVGEPLSQYFATTSTFPSAFRWLSTDPGRQLPAVLQRISHLLIRRAQYQSDWLKVLAPIGLTVFIAGGVTLLYGITLFYTLAGLYKGLAAT